MIGFMISNGDNFQEHSVARCNHFDAVSRLAFEVEGITSRPAKDIPAGDSTRRTERPVTGVIQQGPL